MSSCCTSNCETEGAGMEWRKVQKLLVLQEELKLERSEMEAVVSDSFQHEAYSRDDICKVLEISSEDEELESESLSENDQNNAVFPVIQASYPRLPRGKSSDHIPRHSQLW